MIVIHSWHQVYAKTLFIKQPETYFSNNCLRFLCCGCLICSLVHIFHYFSLTNVLRTQIHRFCLNDVQAGSPYNHNCYWIRFDKHLPIYNYMQTRQQVFNVLLTVVATPKKIPFDTSHYRPTIFRFSGYWANVSLRYLLIDIA